MLYEKFLTRAQKVGIEVYERPMVHSIKGLYINNVIWINKFISTKAEKVCVLVEEIGHHETSVGDILNQSVVTNRKQELLARQWGYEKLVPLESIIEAHKHGIRNLHELAEYIGVTEEFLNSALIRYQDKYGIHAKVGRYTICFEPLGVMELFE